MVKAERLGEIRGFIGGLYGPDLHAKRVDALAGATLGVMTGASLAVAMIGQALAQARGLVTKHAVKQVDRLMSNASIDVWDSFARCHARSASHSGNAIAARRHRHLGDRAVPPWQEHPPHADRPAAPVRVRPPRRL
jgi:hypothetical protein